MTRLLPYAAALLAFCSLVLLAGNMLLRTKPVESSIEAEAAPGNFVPDSAETMVEIQRLRRSQGNVLKGTVLDNAYADREFVTALAGHTGEAAPPLVPADVEHQNANVVEGCRMVARGWEEIAADYEERGEYEYADAARQRADQYRREARTKHFFTTERR